MNNLLLIHFMRDGKQLMKVKANAIYAVLALRSERFADSDMESTFTDLKTKNIMTEQEALNNPEMKTIMLLSRYVRELREGADYETTTYKLAETLVKVFSISHVSQQRELLADFYEHLEQIDKPLRHGNGYKEAKAFLSANCG